MANVTDLGGAARPESGAAVAEPVVGSASVSDHANPSSGRPVPSGPAGYRPHLDGLRTVAVYLVVLFHAGVARFSGGFIGVDVFFVLSGYLVTQVLVRDLGDNGRIRFGRFYARRFRRLLPASAVTLLATAVAYSWVASPVEVDAAAGGIRAAFLYSANWFFIGEASDYFATDQSHSPVLHFWSLAVEEQFYFVWPLAFAGLALGARRLGRHRWNVVRAVVAAVAVASLAWAWHRSGADPNRAYYGTDARAYQLLAGALLALTPALLSRGIRFARVAGPAVLGALAAMVVLSTSYVGVRPVARGIVATVVTAVLIVALERGDGAGRRLLSTKPFVELGRVSYGTYLWHWPVIVIVGKMWSFSPWQLAAMATLLATGLASLSSWLLEMPFREAPRLDRAPRAVVATGLAVSLVCGLVVVDRLTDTGPRDAGEGAEVTLDDLVLTRVPADFDQLAVHEAGYRGQHSCDPTTRRCTFNPGMPQHVVLMGDSNGLMLDGVFIAMAERNGFTLTLATAGGCAWQRGIDYVGLEGSRPGCERMREGLYGGGLEELQPDLIVAIKVREFGDMDQVEFTGTPRQRELREATEASLTQLLDSGARVMVIEPLPRSRLDPLDCLAAARYQEQCRFRSPTEPFWDELQLREAAASNPAITTLDLDRVVCPALPVCDPIIGGEVVRWDAAHLTQDFARKLEPVLTDALRDAGITPGAGTGADPGP